MNKNVSNTSGIKVQMLHDIKESNHFHPEIEIIFVVSGTLGVIEKGNYYELNKKDIILFNSNSMHKVESIENATICKVQISFKVLSEVVNNGNYIFYCNSVSNKVNSYSELQNIMKRIVISYAGHERKTDCLKYGLVFELLDNLIENFQIDGEYFRYKKDNNKSKQIQYIINYINLNFQNSISLNELAQEMYTSSSTLSRFFKKQIGVYFGDFVNEVRLNYAVKELLETDKTITKIWGDCGFSNASTFSKAFQNKYKMSPTAYRRQKALEEKESDKGLELSEEQLKKEIEIFQREEGIKSLGKEIMVQASVSELQSYKKFWNTTLNAGEAHNIILANVQSHIGYLIEQLDFKYVRIWNVFSKKLMIQRDNNDFDYNFNTIDIVLDFLVRSGVKPFIDFGMRPDCAVKTEDETIYYEEHNINFRSINEWNNMLEHFVIHIIKRYGKEEVEKWKFEFTIDVRPNKSYFKDENESLNIIFEHSFKLIKRYLPKAEMGGFGAIYGVNFDRLIEWLNYCHKKECIPDFVSILAFPYTQVEVNGRIFAKRVANENFAAEQVKMAKINLVENGYEQCRLYVTEWNNSLSNRNYLNDSCFRAAYVVKMINELWDIPDAMCMWMGTDLASSYYDTSRIVNGGSGIITKDRIRKPVYYALSFLNRLGDTFIQKGENYIITSNGINSFFILCFNYKEYSYEYYMKDENNLELDNLSNLFEDDDDIKLQINLTNVLEGQKYIIKKHSVNGDCGSVIKQWSKFQYEKDIEGDDLNYLRKICIPDISMEKQIAQNGTLKINNKLKSHEISLIHIYEDN